MGQTQTATVNAETRSVYGVVDGKLIKDKSWVLSFTNPCTEESLVDITPKTQFSPDQDNYSGNDIIFFYFAFDI